MLLTRFLTLFICFHLFIQVATPQENSFELPVQLVGFPVIILAVRLSNFVKKLAYAVNPKTYVGKTKRSVSEMNVLEVEKRLVAELGDRVCVYEDVCKDYADRSLSLDHQNQVLDWENVFRKYEGTPNENKKFYLLSVFLGDIVSSPDLCHRLAKRGRSCQTQEH